MYGADGFGCGIIGQGIANLILTAKWYGFLSRVCFTLIGSTSLGEERVKKLDKIDPRTVIQNKDYDSQEFQVHRVIFESTPIPPNRIVLSS